jgi:hypothetical protein
VVSSVLLVITAAVTEMGRHVRLEEEIVVQIHHALAPLLWAAAACRGGRVGSNVHRSQAHPVVLQPTFQGGAETTMVPLLVVRVIITLRMGVVVEVHPPFLLFFSLPSLFVLVARLVLLLLLGVIVTPRMGVLGVIVTPGLVLLLLLLPAFLLDAIGTSTGTTTTVAIFHLHALAGSDRINYDHAAVPEKQVVVKTLFACIKQPRECPDLT